MFFYGEDDESVRHCNDDTVSGTGREVQTLTMKMQQA